VCPCNPSLNSSSRVWWTVTYLAKVLVDDPGAVEVHEVNEGNQLRYEISVAPEDIGKVIGKQRTTIHAIRSLLLVGAARKGQRCTLEIVEERPEE